MAETIALGSELGVELVDFDDLLDDATIYQCREALKWRGVLLVRGADFDDDAQLAFSRRLGDAHTPASKELSTISLDRKQNRHAEYLKGAFYWHLDDTTSDVPAKATMLTGRRLSAEGGGTEFANTYAAYDNLPVAERKRYDGLRVVHSFEAAQRKVNPDPSEKELAGWRLVPTHETSLVWKRRDGRHSLVIGATADHIVGVSRDESDAILAEILSWATQERFCYTHSWTVGDAVVWDNTGVLHRALPYDPASDRMLRRTHIQGAEAWS